MGHAKPASNTGSYCGATALTAMPFFGSRGNIMTSIPETNYGIYIGAIVNVQGYGGRAKVLNMEVDGYTPQGLPKYLCSVVFGPYSNGQTGTITRFNGKKNGHTRSRKGAPGISNPIHQFYKSKLTNVLDAPDGNTAASIAAQEAMLNQTIDGMDLAGIKARLAEINAKLGA